MNLQILIGSNILNRLEFEFILTLNGRSLDIDMLIELRHLLVIDGFELLEEVFLLLGVLQGVVVVDEMVLFVLGESVEEVLHLEIRYV